MVSEISALLDDEGAGERGDGTSSWSVDGSDLGGVSVSSSFTTS